MRAGHVLIGSVIGTPARLMLSLEVVDVAKGSTRRIRTEGSADSLTQLVDRVAGEVLGYAAGEASERASLLAGVPLPAIRAYLAGRKAHRAGDYAEAGRRHAEALQIDSTFVLAGMGVYSASAWVGQEPKLLAKAQMLAWSNKAALPAAERAIMLAELGPLSRSLHRAPNCWRLRARPCAWRRSGRSRTTGSQNGCTTTVKRSVSRTRALKLRERSSGCSPSTPTSSGRPAT
jgi:hypothetical protein